MNTQEMIKVMQHFADGGEVEFSPISGMPEWGPVKEPVWNWASAKYRITPRKTTLHLYGWLVKGEAKLLESCVSLTGATRLPQLDRVLEVEL